MNIQAINSASLNQQNKPNFKQAIPVVYWVTEAGGRNFTPAVTEELSRTLNTKLVRILNSSERKIFEKLKENLKKLGINNEIIKKIKSSIIEICNLRDAESIKIRINKLIEDTQLKSDAAQKVRKTASDLNITSRAHKYISARDKDYERYPFARGFNNEKGGEKGNRFEPISYIITGNDAEIFEANYGKPIGETKAKLKALGYNPSKTAELQQKLSDYWTMGLDFSKKRAKDFKPKNNEPYELHVEVERQRSNTGKPLGYRILDMKFCPRKGPKNPFEITNWFKQN